MDCFGSKRDLDRVEIPLRSGTVLTIPDYFFRNRYWDRPGARPICDARTLSGYHAGEKDRLWLQELEPAC